MQKCLGVRMLCTFIGGISSCIWPFDILFVWGFIYMLTSFCFNMKMSINSLIFNGDIWLYITMKISPTYSDLLELDEWIDKQMDSYRWVDNSAKISTITAKLL